MHPRKEADTWIPVCELASTYALVVVGGFQPDLEGLELFAEEGAMNVLARTAFANHCKHSDAKLPMSGAHFQTGFFHSHAALTR